MKNKKFEFPWQGMLLISIMGVFAIFGLFSTNFFEIRSMNDFIEYLKAYLFIFVFCIFIFLVAVYIWISFIQNRLIKPKKKVLYLMTIEEGIAEFIDNKGNLYYKENENYIQNEFYDVLKTKDEIKKVIGKSINKFNVNKGKRNYWLNFYSPLIGNFENLLLLPIIYVILIFGILSILLTPGFGKIIGIIITTEALFLITYDLIYKIKLSKNEEFKIDVSKIQNILRLFKKIIIYCSILFVIFIFLTLFLNATDNTTKIIIAPFVLCSFCLFGQLIAKEFNYIRLSNFLQKLYIIIFILYWFGMLMPKTIEFIKTGNYLMLIFIIPFWIAGGLVIYIGFFKKTKK